MSIVVGEAGGSYGDTGMMEIGAVRADRGALGQTSYRDSYNGSKSYQILVKYPM